MINDLLAELKLVDVDELQTTNVKRILRKIPGFDINLPKIRILER